MNKVSTIVIILGILLLGGLLTLIYFTNKQPVDKANLPEKKLNSSEIVDVDAVVRQPERFQDYIGVVGKVISTHLKDQEQFFVLGCEDACIRMPVLYKGQVPEVGSDVIVYGKIKKANDGRYFFEAQEIKVK